MRYTRKKSNCITDYAIMYIENPEVSKKLLELVKGFSAKPDCISVY